MVPQVRAGLKKKHKSALRSCGILARLIFRCEGLILLVGIVGKTMGRSSGRYITFFCLVLILTGCFFLGLVTAALAQDAQSKDGGPTLLGQDQTKTEDLIQDSKQPSQDFWQHLELLRLNQGKERKEENNRIQAFSLYPQSFSAVKPEVLQTAPARSYLLSLSDQEKVNTPVGLANIADEEKVEIQNGYHKNVNTELLVGYQWGGVGSILFGRGLQLEREGDTFSRVNDMGWRLKFMKTF